MTAIQDFYLVKKVEIGAASNGSSYLNLTLYDGEKSLPAKKWDFSGEPPGVGDVIHIRATMGEYRGNPQATINDYRVAEKDEVSVEQFLPATKQDVDEMFQRILAAVKVIIDRDLQNLVSNILETYEKCFKVAPASISIHHGYLGGLIEHTLSVLNLAVTAARQTPENLDRDLVIAGAILHDIGKIHTYTWERGFIERSDLGRLIEHLVIGPMMIKEAANDMGIEFIKIQKLLHIIVSHHGKKEWGSPVEPATKEAMIVHRADELDSKMAIVDEALANKETQDSWFYLKPGNNQFFAG